MSLAVTLEIPDDIVENNIPAESADELAAMLAEE